MSHATEIEIINKSLVPPVVYHMVPEKFLHLFSDAQGTYDCRNQQDWGRNSPFIHTTTSVKDLKERVAPTWETYPMTTVFVLLIIDTAKIFAKFTCTIQNGVTYFHIWGSLPAESFNSRKVSRDQDGKFLL